MADVLIVCVREDELQAKALADMFERAGFTVGGAPASDGALRSTGAGVIVWSQASIRSRPFLDAAQRVIDAEKAVVASLIDPPPPDSIGHSPAFALNGWTGDPEDPALDPLFFAVDRMVNSQRASVGASPARPAAAAFQEPPSLRPPPAAPSRAAPIPPPQPAAYAREHEPHDQLGSEAEHWRAIRNSRNPADFMDYLARYGAEGAFSEVAELRLKQLTAAPQPSNLHEAARAAAPPSRRPEPPPQARRAEPAPVRRVEPATPPRVEPAPRRPEPAPVARRAEPPPPRREPPPVYGRDYASEPAEPSRAGLLRILVLVLLLGGGALAAGLYFNGGGQAGDQVAEQQTQADPLSDPLAPAEYGVGGSENVEEPVELASAAPNPAEVRRQEQRERERTRQRELERQRQQEAEKATPPPAPRTSWTEPQAAPATAVPLNPPSQQLAANTTAPGGPAQIAPPPAGQPAATQTAATSPPQQPRAAPAPPQGTVVWAQRPSARRISDLYPSRALRDGAGGRVELACTVRADLSLACAVASETPGGGGFGPAALSAASAYRARPTLSDGSASAGARTRIAIVFQPPAE